MDQPDQRKTSRNHGKTHSRPLTAANPKKKDGHDKDLKSSKTSLTSGEIEKEISISSVSSSAQSSRRSSVKDINNVKIKTAKGNEDSNRPMRTKTAPHGKMRISVSGSDKEDFHIISKVRKSTDRVKMNDDGEDGEVEECENESEKKYRNSGGSRSTNQSLTMDEADVNKASESEMHENSRIIDSSNKCDPTMYFYRSDDLALTSDGYPSMDLLDFTEDMKKSELEHEDIDDDETLSESEQEESTVVGASEVRSGEKNRAQNENIWTRVSGKSGLGVGENKEEEEEETDKMMPEGGSRFTRGDRGRPGSDNKKEEKTKVEKSRSTSGKMLLSSAPSSSSSSLRPKSSAGADSSERVKVIVRSRPLSKKEIEEGHELVVEVFPETNEIEVLRPTSASSSNATTTDRKVFAFDSVYDSRISQLELYDEAFQPLVDSVLEGFNGTIFAYGQTGTGKTYTMEGMTYNNHKMMALVDSKGPTGTKNKLENPSINANVLNSAGTRNDEEHHGVIPNAFKHIFKEVAENPHKQFLIRASYLEIYQEEIRDLLSKERNQHRELKESTSGVYVKDLSTFLCSNFNEINDLMTRGNKNRAVGATNMNEHSSRSHAIFQITVEVSEEWSDGRNHIRVGKLNLVDLAGSERQTKTGATGKRLKEATKINLSLSALGNVIAALVDGKSTHIPYRDSKLTRLLQDSLGGNSRTIMVATVGPASFNWDETMTTLRYASRAKKIKNKPKVNEDPKDAMLRQYQEEIIRLRTELAKKKEKQQSMLKEHGGESKESKSQNSSASRRAATASSSNSSLTEQLKMVEEQRLKELAPLLKPYGLDPSTNPKDIMTQLEQRRQALLRDNLTVKAEKDELLMKLEETQNLVKCTEEECIKLTERIQWLESKVLTGGKSLLDHTNEQQKLIEEKQKELAEQNRRYEEVRKKLEENELTTAELRHTLNELDQEYQVKTKKLKKLTQKLLSTREELGTISEEYTKSSKDIQGILVELKKELALKRVIIENFIPAGSRKMIENRIRWEDTEEAYKMLPYDSSTLQRPPRDTMVTSPLYNLSEFPVHNIKNVYYTNENILQLTPELPTPLCRDYVPPTTDPYYTSLIKRAVDDAEKEVVIDCSRLHKKRTKTAGIQRPRPTGDYFQFGDYVVRRVKSARPSPGSSVPQYQDFTVVRLISQSGTF